MSVSQYIGARYVPLLADPAEWNDERTYEPLTIVLHEGNSYTSKQFVPRGVDIDNKKFWEITGNYNAQVELYRQDVVRYATKLNAVSAALNAEVTRATAAEGKLTEDLDTEVIRAKKSESYINATRYKSYETVADMKLDNELMPGDIAVTKGYHRVGDNGAAFYTVVAGLAPNNMDLIECVNGTAKLIADSVKPEMLGANADGITDDTEYIKRGLTFKKLILSTGKRYLISETIELTNDTAILDAKNSKIVYSGNEYAIRIRNLNQNCDVKIGSIVAAKGGCLELRSFYINSDNYDYVQYVNIYFDSLICLDKAIYVHAEKHSWVNEIRFYGGQIGNCNYGIYCKGEVGEVNTNNYMFINVGFEVPEQPVYLEDVETANWTFLNCRETETTNFLKTVGKVNFIYIYSNSIITRSKFNVSPNTNYVYVYGTLEEGINGSIIKSPITSIFNGNVFSTPQYGSAFNKHGGEPIDLNTTVNDYPSCAPITYVGCDTSTTVNLKKTMIPNSSPASIYVYNFGSSKVTITFKYGDKTVKTAEIEPYKSVKLTIVAISGNTAYIALENIESTFTFNYA